MADNFVRKTVQQTNKVPKIDFYDVGDFVITKNGILYLCTMLSDKKAFAEIPNIGHILNLSNNIKALETKLADHESRIKALETPTA